MTLDLRIHLDLVTLAGFISFLKTNIFICKAGSESLSLPGEMLGDITVTDIASGPVSKRVYSSEKQIGKRPPQKLPLKKKSTVAMMCGVPGTGCTL